MEVSKNVREFALIGFLLLAVLFGFMIMTFIFGTLDPINSATYSLLTATVNNESGYALNGTSFKVANASLLSWGRGFTVVIATNASSGLTISAANYTVNAVAGIIVNATADNFAAVNLTYTHLFKNTQQLLSESVTNSSLVAIDTYAANASTQFTTLSIAIILILLLAVFAVFWIAFMGKGKEGEGMAGGDFT